MHTALSLLRRLLIAALLTAGLIGSACAGLFVTDAPKLVSLLAEPLSLLLMPGVAMSLAIYGQRDVAPLPVLAGSASFYFVFFGVALTSRARRTHTQRGSA